MKKMKSKNKILAVTAFAMLSLMGVISTQF